jgi:hypothetical protein
MATYIMMVGRICGDSFNWNIAMPPLEEVELAPQIVPSENMLVSRYMNRNGFLGYASQLLSGRLLCRH